MTPKVFIVIPVHNRLHFTKECLIGIAKQNYKNVETIVVDDGSSDETFEFVRKKYPNIHLILGDGNLWWSKAVSLGIDYALAGAGKNDFILLLNNDCYLGKGYLKQVIKTAQKYKRSIIASLCVTVGKKEKVVEAGVRINWPTGLVYSVAEAVSQDPTYYKKMDLVRDLDALPGKGTLVPIEVFKEIGGINFKRLPHYIADYEFFNRAKRRGWELLVDTKAIVKHNWGATGYKRGRKRRSIWQYRDLLISAFNRKSMNNVFDWIIFLWLACPREYLVLNYYITFFRIVDGITSIFPFTILRPLVRFILWFNSSVWQTGRRTKLLVSKIVYN